MKQEQLMKLNAYLANQGVFYIKLHNLHWNVVGKEFKAVHEFYEALYDATSDVLDEVAELIRMANEFPIGSIKKMLEVSTIKELDDVEVRVVDSLKIVLDDLVALRNEAVELRKLSDEMGDFVVVGYLEGNISQYNKNIWFIESMLK